MSEPRTRDQSAENVPSDYDDCCVKHCDEPSIYGLTMVLEGLRVELYACERHFDILAGSHNDAPSTAQTGPHTVSEDAQ